MPLLLFTSSCRLRNQLDGQFAQRSCHYEHYQLAASGIAAAAAAAMCVLQDHESTHSSAHSCVKNAQKILLQP
jgi:hypothetical protein